MSDTKKQNFMYAPLIHFLYRTRDTVYHLMSVDIEYP